MKEILRQYGLVLVALLVGVVIIAMYGWLMPMAIQPVNMETSVLMQDDMPEISYQEVWSNYGIEGTFDGAITKGQETAVENHLRADSKAGEALVMLCRIYDEEGQNIPWITKAGKEYFCFEREGIYTVYFVATDANGIRQYEKVRIPVQREAV